jgi:hypothetical protein
MKNNGFETLYSIDLLLEFATKEEVRMFVLKRLELI